MPKAKAGDADDRAIDLRRGLDLRQLQVFVEVAEAGSMTAAAQRLGISQAAASQQIARLEERLGMALLDRVGRDVRPTTAGARLIDEGRILLDNASSLFRTLDRYRTAEVPTLRLYVLESLATILVPKLVPKLKSRVGQLEIHCALQFEREHELVLDKEAVALTSMDFASLRADGAFPILDEPFVAVAPSSIGRKLRACDLVELALTSPFIRYVAKRRLAAQVDKIVEVLGLQPSTVLSVDSSPALIGLVASGCGWTITTPSNLLASSGDPTTLSVINLERDVTRRRICLIADDHRLMRFPHWIANECCAILKEEMRAIERFGSSLAPAITIGDSRLG